MREGEKREEGKRESKREKERKKGRREGEKKGPFSLSCTLGQTVKIINFIKSYPEHTHF